MSTSHLLGQPRPSVFVVGDYLSGGLTGAAVAGAVRVLVGSDLDMVLAMLVGMLIGTVVHLAIGIAISPLLGLWHCMVPGALIGMYGGMLFAMRDVMQHTRGSLGHAMLVGALFGVTVTVGVRLYDRAVRAPNSVTA